MIRTFPPGFMHAIAVKSNPVCSMLELAMKQVCPVYSDYVIECLIFHILIDLL